MVKVCELILLICRGNCRKNAAMSALLIVSKSIKLKFFHWSDIECLQIMNFLEIKVPETVLRCGYVTDTRVKL